MFQKIVIKEFKKIIKEMYKGYPMFYYWGMLEDKFGRKDIVPLLLKDKIIIKCGYDPNTGQMRYRLGVEGLKLVEQWSVEKLTKLIIVLTVGLFILGIIQICLLI